VRSVYIPFNNLTTYMSPGNPNLAGTPYALAAKRMAGPVIAATATRVAAFSPLLFWPGVVGQFMKYLPITLIATLSASLAVALFFTPTLGALLGKASANPHDERAKDRGPYMRTVRLALRRPGLTLALAALLLVVVQVAYGKFGHGVEFFPKVEPDYGQVVVHARGNLAFEAHQSAGEALCVRVGQNYWKNSRKLSGTISAVEAPRLATV